MATVCAILIVQLLAWIHRALLISGICVSIEPIPDGIRIS